MKLIGSNVIAVPSMHIIASDLEAMQSLWVLRLILPDGSENNVIKEDQYALFSILVFVAIKV
jgi:hypothetical protein